MGADTNPVGLDLAHLSKPVKRSRRTTLVARHIAREIRRDVPTVLVTSPLVVPIWWGVWKLCDTLWSLK